MFRLRRVSIALCLSWALGCAPALTADELLPTLSLQLPKGPLLTLDVVTTAHQRSLGLMFRPQLAPDQGMLFIFPQVDRHAIWMKNVLMALDILWLDEQRQIVHIEKNVPPCKRTPCPIYRPTTPARYVIELSTGTANAHQLRSGIILAFRLDDLDHTVSPPQPSDQTK